MLFVMATLLVGMAVGMNITTADNDWVPTLNALPGWPDEAGFGIYSGTI